MNAKVIGLEKNNMNENLFKQLRLKKIKTKYFDIRDKKIGNSYKKI